MENGDIAAFDRPQRACMFEGLLAQPPTSRFLRFKRSQTDNLNGWKANELPLKSLIDNTNRLGVHTLVFTFLGEPYEELIYRWLLNKGVSCTVLAYDDIPDALEDFKYNRSLQTILVPDQDLAHMIGIRAKVVSSDKAWSV